uniref:Uncharacterized protein n=1 Tax=Panagrolaimus superbus TaxID=310955 RepID=A0A914YPE7_9BILA
MHNPVINNRTSAYSGILMQKSSQSNYIYTSFSTDLVDKFFVGRNHPIEYSPAFEKVLNLNYDQENINVEIDVASGCGEFLEKPGILSFDLFLNYLVDQRRRTNKNMDEVCFFKLHDT